MLRTTPAIRNRAPFKVREISITLPARSLEASLISMQHPVTPKSRSVPVVDIPVSKHRIEASPLQRKRGYLR